MLFRSDGDSDVNMFIGAEKTLGPFLSVIAEYNLGLNDSGGDALGEGKGYLNASIRCSVGSGFSLGFNFKDILHNRVDDSGGRRTLQMEFARTY